MKKIIITSICAMTLNAVLQAQVRIAPKAGVSISKFSGSTVKNSNYTGYYIGTMVQVDLGKDLKIQPEVLFVGEGAKFNDLGMESELHYLDIPVLLNYSCKHGFIAVTGPQFGLLLDAVTKAGNNKVDAKGAFKPSDFSWVFGVGYKTHGNLGINARYNVGLSDISKNDTQKVRNSVFQAGIFCFF